MRLALHGISCSVILLGVSGWGRDAQGLAVVAIVAAAIN